VKFAFIAAEKASFPVTLLCRVLKVSRSGFHAWVKREPSERAKRDALLANDIAALHRRFKRTYGSPRIHAELRAKGHRISRKRVERIMRLRGLRTKLKRRTKKTTDSKHSLPIAPNLLERKFDVHAPNTVWVTDVAAIWTNEGWLYLAPMLDLFARRVVGWDVSASNDAELALSALRRSVASRRPPRGILHHSDRGSPYASDAYRAELGLHGFTQSMSRKGNCWDNAVAESFFASLRAELTDHVCFETRDQAERAIADYIEDFYNVARRHSSLGYLCPIEYELRSHVERLVA